MVFRLLACVVFSLVIGCSAVAVAADVPPANPKNDPKNAATPTEAAKEDKRIFGGFPHNIYAFPGKECPPDSVTYTGPEQKDLEKTNAVYCVFMRHYAWLYKTPNLDRCPDGKEPVLITERHKNSYTSGRYTTQIMWCDMPNARFMLNGLMVPMQQEKPVQQGKEVPPPPKPAVPVGTSTVGTPNLPDLLKGVKNTPPPMAPSPVISNKNGSANTSQPAQPTVNANMPVGTSSPPATSAPETPETAASGGFMKKIFDFFKGSKPSETPPPAANGN